METRWTRVLVARKTGCEEGVGVVVGDALDASVSRTQDGL
jgi:hypothetical protein